MNLPLGREPSTAATAAAAAKGSSLQRAARRFIAASCSQRKFTAVGRSSLHREANNNIDAVYRIWTYIYLRSIPPKNIRIYMLGRNESNEITNPGFTKVLN